MKYTMKDPTVDAVFWDGKNRESVYEFFRPFLEPQYGAQWREYIQFSADEESGVKYDDYNMVKWEGCGGPEVDPGRWIVSTVDPESGDREYTTWRDTEFQASMKPVHEAVDDYTCSCGWKVDAFTAPELARWKLRVKHMEEVR